MSLWVDMHIKLDTTGLGRAVPRRRSPRILWMPFCAETVRQNIVSKSNEHVQLVCLATNLAEIVAIDAQGETHSFAAFRTVRLN